jgi:hypothetical protein
MQLYYVKCNLLKNIAATMFLSYAFFWVIPRRLNFMCQLFRTLRVFHAYPPMKMEQTECSETSAHKIQTPRNCPEESVQHSEHGESLKSRIQCFCFREAIFRL